MCGDCGKRYKYKKSLNRHRYHECGSSKNNFSCELCDYRASRRYKLKEHLSMKHGIETATELRHLSEKEINYIKHAASDSLLDGFAPELLDIKPLFYNKTLMGPTAVVKLCKQYVCDCGKRYTYKSGLYQHRKHECGDMRKNHVCVDCGRRYTYPAGLYQHRKHECGKEAKFQCELCPYRSKLKGNLRIHYAHRHQNMVSSMDQCHISNYMCPLCGRFYKYKSGWYQHRKYECGKAPAFQCHLCPYKCKQKSSLKIHLSGKHSLSNITNSAVDEVQMRLACKGMGGDTANGLIRY
ncbi:zinc finger protein 62 homolog [Macrosteles quadrilineatus]|uniref:zinc finger protein 62 homolog n=1 Tax=Macrosteles quadrilineatus TaxID=74068 RepID=UPI0023E19CEA|nr:zinc finger protein 62 homolog [Macrosteles quadrilineatus]